MFYADAGRIIAKPIDRAHDPMAGSLAPVMEQALAAEKLASFYKEALDHAAIVAVTDARGTIRSVNSKFCELSGYSEAELIGSNHRIVRSGKHDRAFFLNLYRTIARGAVWQGEICNRAKDGSLYWVDTTIVPHRGSDGAIESYIAIRFDLTRQKLAERHLWDLANNDALTGLPNRLKFMFDLEHALAEARDEGTGLAVGLLDIDLFKDINDSLGHAAGDHILCEVAQRIRAVLRKGDDVARLGGDEFALIFRRTTGDLDQRNLAERIMGALAEPIDLYGTERRLSVSVGIASFPSAGNCSADLLRSADIALYAAKGNGRGKAELFNAAMNRRVQRRDRLLTQFEHALRNAEFTVHYQPMVPLEDGGPVALEALLRWHHPQVGTITPPHFAEALSEDRFAAQVDRFVLETVIDQIGAWRAEGLPFTAIAVNVAPGDLRTPHYVDRVLQAIADRQIAHNDLWIEINENVLLSDAGGKALAEIERLHDAGVKIAFDDFGTGFASLRHLRDVPVDQVKIDTGFMQALERDSADRAIVSSIIDLAHRLGKTVTAEGVETDSQLAILRDMGCDHVQGYLIAHALDPAGTERFLRRE